MKKKQVDLITFFSDLNDWRPKKNKFLADKMNKDICERETDTCEYDFCGNECEKKYFKKLSKNPKK